MKTQQEKHVLVGAMIKGQSNMTANAELWREFDTNKVFNKRIHRGGIGLVPHGKTFGWNFTQLNNNVQRIRKRAGYVASDPNFHIVTNVNTYQTPGYEEIPQSGTGEGLTAFGSGWSLPYNLFPLENQVKYEENHESVLDKWKDLPQDPKAKDKISSPKLGREKAKHVLRTLTKKYVSENKNFVIPHRGLRNEVIKKIKNLGIISKIRESVGGDYVSIINLDDDMQIKNPGTIKSILEGNSKRADLDVSIRKKNKQGIAFSSPGYIYNMEANLLEYTASVLSHIGGRVINEAYPAEPGLTLTYHKSIEDDIWANFLESYPWGEESTDLNKLPSYGRKQRAARVESKEGRAFAAKFSRYMVKHRDGLKSKKAQYKIPIRSNQYFPVDMSGLAKAQILGDNPPQSVVGLSQEEVLEMVVRYIKNNKYHPLNSQSKRAKQFMKKELPIIASEIYKLIKVNGTSINHKQERIRTYLQEKYTDLQ
ncbi:hypothetical protein L1286_11155 [Pseudoalteromonas sp. SMS1]|uniref:hypothetical protein n=1 Tax=Pseudoalteromonas sp. SMS1 TaxID=2908894 RepID=UPI001F360F67|nr:hypothetical protein [Pseudoalteromonas sp. SMS1]MCF2858030.1 hypothetical protein [Pseudoalteromonas sp. SMS1]